MKKRRINIDLTKTQTGGTDDGGETLYLDIDSEQGPLRITLQFEEAGRFIGFLLELCQPIHQRRMKDDLLQGIDPRFEPLRLTNSTKAEVRALTHESTLALLVYLNEAVAIPFALPPQEAARLGTQLAQMGLSPHLSSPTETTKH